MSEKQIYRVLAMALERLGRENSPVGRAWRARECGQYLALMSREEVEVRNRQRTDLTWEELRPYLRVLGVSATDLLEGQESTVKGLIPLVEAEILRMYESVGRVLSSTTPEIKLKSLSERASHSQSELSRVRTKQRRLVQLGAQLLSDCASHCSSLQSRRSEEENAKDPAFILQTRVRVVTLRRLCIEHSLQRDLYTPSSLSALRLIRKELESRLEAVKDRIAIHRDKLDRFTYNPRLRQYCEEYQRLRLEILQKRRDIEKLGA